MKKIIITLIACTGFFTFATAQKDAKAKELLDKSSAAFSQAGDIYAYFTMNIKDGINKTSQSFDGTVQMKGNKFKIDTPDQNIYFDGKTQWVYQKSYEEVNVSEPTGEEIQALNPKSIFAIYKKNCNYKYVGSKTDIKMRKVLEVNIFPQKGEIAEITIQMNDTDHFPVMFHIFYKNKIENIIYINKYQTKQNFPDNQFVFDGKQHPNVEIIDLR
jgi:outer membrane lipoprotein-sorting protein